MIDLGTLGDFDCQSVAYDINDLGQIVGDSTYDSSSTDLHTFLYADGTMVDLNDLIDPASGWTLVSASAVNDNGWIVGYGVNADGDTHAFLLTPVPEPSTAALALIAAAGLLFATWRQNSRAG